MMTKNVFLSVNVLFMLCCCVPQAAAAKNDPPPAIGEALQKMYRLERADQVFYEVCAAFLGERGEVAAAGMFRAAAACEKVHAEMLAELLREDAGQVPDVSIAEEVPDPSAAAGQARAREERERPEREAAIASALSAGHDPAIRALEFIRRGDEVLDELFSLSTRGSVGARLFWVCPRCGYVYSEQPTADCAVCDNPKESLIETE